MNDDDLLKDLAQIPSAKDQAAADLAAVPKAPPAPPVQQTISDYAKQFARGAASQLVTAPGQLMVRAGLQPVTRDLGLRLEKQATDAMSPAAKAVGASSFLGEGGDVFGPYPVQKALSAITESAPGLIGLAASGRLAARPLQQAQVGERVAGAVAAAGVPQVIAKGVGEVAETAPYWIGEGLQAGGGNAAQVGQQLRDAGQTPVDKMASTDAFQQAMRESLTANPGWTSQQHIDAVRESLAQRAESEAFDKTMLATSGIGAITGAGALGVLNRRLGGQDTGGFLRTARRGAVEEALQEMPQSGGEQLIANYVARKYGDPEQSLLEGVGEAVALGGVAGAATGGGLAAGVYPFTRRRPDETPPGTAPEPMAPPPDPSGPLGAAVAAGQKSGAIPTNPIGGPTDEPPPGPPPTDPGGQPGGTDPRRGALSEAAQLAASVPAGTNVPETSALGRRIADATNRAAAAGATQDEIEAARAGQAPQPSPFEQRPSWKSLPEVESFLSQARMQSPQAPMGKPVQRADGTFTFALPGEPEFDALEDARNAPAVRAERERQAEQNLQRVESLSRRLSQASQAAQKAREAGDTETTENAESLANVLRERLQTARTQLELTSGTAAAGADMDAGASAGVLGTGGVGAQGGRALPGGGGAADDAGVARPADGGVAPEGVAATPADGGGTRPVVLQNRDRSGVASVTQMQSIAANPDPRRLSFSRDFGSGAPVVFSNFDEARLVDAQLGREDTITDSQGRQYAIQYAVIEADEVVASNAADGTPNDLYEDSATPGLIRAVAGNGRMAGLQEAFRRGTAAGYAQGIAADTALHGIDPAVIDAMSNPVLVRIMRADDVTPDIGDRSNVSGAARLNPVEQARTDMARVNLEALDFNESGDPTPAAVKAFVSAMPEAERSELMTRDGAAGRQAIDRLMAATFAKAYGDERLVELYAQATDPDARNVLSAMAQAAGAMAKLEGMGDLDVRPLVIDAANMAVNAARNGVSLAKFVQTPDITLAPEVRPIAQMMAENARSARRMAESLRALADLAYSEATKESADMFGEVPRRTRGQVIEEVFGGQGREGGEGAVQNAGRAGMDEAGAAGQGDAPGQREPAGDTGQPQGQGSDRPADGQDDAFGLTSYSLDELAQRDAELEQTQADQQAEQDRRAAVPPADDFVLSGSDRPADQAAARGQMELGEAPVDAAAARAAAAPTASPVNDRPLHAGAARDTLVLMACSQTKVDTATPVPLLELYSGPLWSSLRTNLGAIPKGNVFVMSGKHGFVRGDFKSAAYEQRLTEEKAQATIADAAALAQLVRRDKPWRNVVIVGSSEYRAVFDAIVNEAQAAGLLADDAAIVAPEAAGANGQRGGIGLQRMRMNQALGQVNGAKPKSKTALIAEARELVNRLRVAGMANLAEGLKNRLPPGKVLPENMIRSEADLESYYELLERNGKGVDAAAAQAATSPKNDTPEPTDAQKDAGNYKKGHVRIAGLDIAIENEAGTRRRPEWPELPAHYGYIKRTEGADGDQVDVFVKPGTPEDFDGPVFVIDQHVDGKFDEHKVMLGWGAQPAAAKAYRDAYTKDWKGMGAIRRMTLDEFKAWMANGDTTAQDNPVESGFTAAESTGVPTFATYADAQEWIEEQSKAAGGKKAFAATDEYRKVYPQVKALYDAERAATADAAMKRFAESGLKIGDRVSMYLPGMFLSAGRTVTGTIIERGGFPVVKIDGELDVSSKGRISTVKSIRWDARWKKDEAAQTAPTKAPDAQQSAKLDDVGEQLYANRRNFVGRGLKWDDVAGLNDTLKVKEVKKAKAWPKPDYEKLIADGMPAVLARMVKHVYDGIGAGPTIRGTPTDADLQRYIDTLTKVREAIFGFAQDKEAVTKFAGAVQSIIDRERQSSGMPLMSVIQDARALADTLLVRVWPEEMAKPSAGRFRRGSDASNEALVIGGNRALRAMQFDRNDLTKWAKDIGAGWPAAREAWQVQGYRVLAPGGYVISDEKQSMRYNRATAEFEPTGETYFGVIADGERRTWSLPTKPAKGSFLLVDQNGSLVRPFESEEAAVAAARELVKREKGVGQDDRGTNIAESERVGPTRRQEGENVSGERLMEVFGFRGVNFGREGWIKQAERQEYLNAAYDGLLDLAELLNVPPKAMSLDGALGIAFGAQGSGQSAAHFMPGVNEINLTKTRGAGTLAHEWGHALDHYFATQAGLAKDPEPMVSEHAHKDDRTQRIVVGADGKRKVESVPTFGDGIRPEIVQAFRAIVKAMDKRPETESEAKMRQAVMLKDARARSERWLAHVRKNVAGSTAADKDALLASFDRHAEAIRAGDPGEGYAQSGNLAFSPRVADIRDLVKQATGRLLPKDESQGLQNAARWLRGELGRKEASDEHVPQGVTTDFSKESLELDRLKSKTGKKRYWSTPTEMFARAFETYVHERLAARGQVNTFLTNAQELSEKMAEVPDNSSASARGSGAMRSVRAYPYPRGVERETINAAFDTLVGAIETRETDTGGVAMFSRGTGTGLPVENVTRLADAIRRTWANGPEVVVVADMQDRSVPERVRQYDADQRSQGATGEPEGFYYGGKVYLVAGQLNGAADVVRVLSHEALGHYGLRGLYGGELGRILDQIANVRRADVAAKVQEYGLPDTVQGRRVAAEEVLAVMAQTNPQLGFVRRAVAAIRQWLRGLGMNLQMTDADIVAQFIIPARQWVMQGGKAGSGVPAFSRTPTRMTEEQARAAGFTMKAYRGVSKSAPFNASGTTWATTNRDVAQAYAEEVFGYDDAAVVTVMVKPDGLPQHDIRKMDEATLESLEPDEFGNPQAPGVYRNSDDHSLGNSVDSVTVIHAPNDAVAVVDDAGARFSRRATDLSPLGFYSELARKVEGGPGRADAANWKSFIRSQKGIKPDEIEWSGINEFLDLQQGKITKEAVREYLAANGVRIEQVVLSDATVRALPDGFTLHDNGDGTWSVLDAKGDEVSEGESEQEAIANAQDESEYESTPGAPKFGTYVLPGGENYREVLLTLPDRQEAIDEHRAFLARLRTKYPGTIAQRSAAMTADERAQLDRLAARANTQRETVQFRSGHWDQPNVLAHVRLNDRTDADGRRVLFVEEIQSDFGQDFRKQRDAIAKAVDSDFEGIVERMERAGVLTVECD